MQKSWPIRKKKPRPMSWVWSRMRTDLMSQRCDLVFRSSKEKMIRSLNFEIIRHYIHIHIKVFHNMYKEERTLGDLPQKTRVQKLFFNHIRLFYLYHYCSHRSYYIASIFCGKFNMRYVTTTHVVHITSFFVIIPTYHIVCDLWPPNILNTYYLVCIYLQHK